MMTAVKLQERAERFLQALIADVAPQAGTLEVDAPFGESGFDSFHILRFIKRLEADFGTLPKTLLFENFTLRDLGQYFVREHGQRLREMTGGDAAHGECPTVAPAARDAANTALTEPLPSPPVERQGPLILAEREARRAPDLGSRVLELFDRYKHESSVSRGTRNIAPLLFIGSRRKGYFHFSLSGDIALAYAYTGDEADFAELVGEFLAHCRAQGLQPNLFTDRPLEPVAGVEFSATTFGALQRVHDIRRFSLNGGAMRKLRYMVSKFAKAGACRLQEFRCGEDPALAAQIAEVIDEWCASKAMVNPLIRIVREEILDGTLDPSHRLFLCFVDERLHNAILITPLCDALNGYLMDLEFYRRDMPLGGLEYAIVGIIETLAGEGRDLLSLGGTYGCRLDASPHPDPVLEQTLDALHKQNLFNDAGNLQFKNKFAPENRSIYLCRPVGWGRGDNALDIILMIADPERAQAVPVAPALPQVTPPPGIGEARADYAVSRVTPAAVGLDASADDASQVRVSSGAARLDGDERSARLCDAGFNPLNLPADAVDFDLKTDSWAQLTLPTIAARMGSLHAQLPQARRVEDALQQIFPFEHFTLCRSGRSAEQVLCSAWPRRGVVPQNLLFPTAIVNQIEQGFSPLELPSPSLLDPASDDADKAGIDLQRLAAQLSARAGDIPFVWIELSDNAAGGLPVGLDHLQQLRALLAPHSIPLVVDATRILENGRLLAERDPACNGRAPLAIVHDLLRLADVAVASLPKDFAIDRGGLIATRDGDLHARFQQAMRTAGVGLDALEAKLVGLAVSRPALLEEQVARRVATAAGVWQVLRDQAVPLVAPVGGHCVLVDVKAMPAFGGLRHPVASFLCWLYLATGVRGGAHSVGMQKDAALSGLVRLAIPVGLRRAEAAELISRLDGAFRAPSDIPDVEVDGQALVVNLHARHRLRAIRRPTRAVIELDAPAVAVKPSAIAADAVASISASTSSVGERRASAPPPSPAQGKAPPASASGGPAAPMDIAIVGMAGRYPQASNLDELWSRLLDGADCIELLPEARLAQRRDYQRVDRYRGGFIADIDRFDSLFFNIAPRDAERLDPQERLFLEVAWETLEDAGYCPEALGGEDGRRDVGVFVGAVWALYQMLGVEERHLGAATTTNSFLWSIANRVSYFMNLSGPSLAVDTACSSSLTALHLACEAIRNGDCSSALVGGVNLDVHQSKLEINTTGGALSADGVCRSFGEGANGYVAGEGVGALYLKPLQRAQADGDHIYGVVKGVAVNHGGRTSGYTVPSPKAQSELIRSALARAGVDARSIGYIEAHGTGTELGDPIEITGLARALHVEQATGRCAVGSIKSNIGHLEAAAGVVGISKVLLQMRHRKLVPSLHSARLNPHIDFAGSPLYVVQGVEDWAPRSVDGVSAPLRAGVSSFGAGGANAHVVLEAYDAPPRDALAWPSSDEGWIFPLSARTEDQLRSAATRLRRFVERASPASLSANDLADIADTLQRGRRCFDLRLAVVACSASELIERLDLYLQGRAHERVLVGHARNVDGITALLDRGERATFMELLTRGRDPVKLAQGWVDGLLGDWQAMPRDANRRRVPLPTYPFADRRHWVGDRPAHARPAQAAVTAALHPLVDANVSTFERQLFSKTFHERDFFIYDHKVAEIPTLPGVAYLEWVRRAGELAAQRPVRRIRNILWLSPIAVVEGRPKLAHVELWPSGDDVQFEVYSDDADGRRTLHSQGKLQYATPEEAASAPEYVDLDAIRARCSPVIDGDRAYPIFRSLGLDLGPSFQVVRSVLRNDAETLGELCLPEDRVADLQDLLLHPSLVDGSLQAGMSAKLLDPDREMMVPFSLGEVEILHPLVPHCFSYVTEPQDGRKPGSRVSKGNVLIVDESGRVLVRIRESTGVPLHDVHKSGGAGEEADFAPLHYAYAWEPADVVATPAQCPAGMLLFAEDEALFESLRGRREVQGLGSAGAVLVMPGEAYTELGEGRYRIDPTCAEHYVRLLAAIQREGVPLENIAFAWGRDFDWQRAAPATAELQSALEAETAALLLLSQALIGARLPQPVRLVHLYAQQAGPQPHRDAVGGFLKALQLEHPKIVCSTVALLCAATPDAWLDAWLATLGDAGSISRSTRIEADRRWHKRIARVVLPSQTADAPGAARQGGVYLITGGAGGLGLLFAEYLAREYGARLLLMGRSARSEAVDARLAQLAALGGEAIYHAGDVAQRADVDAAVALAEQRFGRLDGVIHAAGVLRDAFVRNKRPQDLSTVAAPKILGCANLDAATRETPLDFFVLFSSLAAIGGNAGQSDYCFANQFLDAFAEHREAERAAGRRHGRSLSINWALWADGGMSLDEQAIELFRKTLGMRPLSADVGLTSFAQALASPYAQVAVLDGRPDKIEAAWGLNRPADTPVGNAVEPSAMLPDDGLVERVEAQLTQFAVDFLKLEPEDIEADRILLDLGFDSIGLTRYANSINDRYGLDITPVLFFDYPSIAEIARHLCSERRAELQAHEGVGGLAPTLDGAVDTPAAEAAAAATGTARIDKRRNAAAPQPAVAAPTALAAGAAAERFVNQPIAIVGMAGVMPQSEDLEAFWENLRDARHLVSEIPADRWRWQDYDGDPQVEQNKSNSRWGGFMHEVDKFDPLFFGISPREAQMMDPQQRIFLETVWKAVEDSGHKVSDLSGTKTGLFVGVAVNDYADLMNSQQIGLDGYTASGNSHSVLANRVSFLLNLRGPSAPLDTACSSSLVAIHRAIESIHTGSSDMAIAGGVQVMLTPAAFVSFSMAGMLSGDGRCKTFDARANGYVRGEGAGAIFLKPLERAQADGDPIHAVIKATAENHGGRVTTLTAPNSVAQTELLIEAYEKARLDPSSVGYIECHGTGTSLGDPIEIQALSRAFAELYKRHGKPIPAAPHCGLSAVKTNIGHLETAAGIAGVLKALLALRHREIPALLHFETLNPYIDLRNTPFYVVDRTRVWDAPVDDAGRELPRNVGVSSFGFGGANAHVVLQEYPVGRPRAVFHAPGPHLVVLSAKTPERLAAYAGKLLAHVRRHRPDIADVAYTLQVGRDAMHDRLAIVADDLDQLETALEGVVADRPDAQRVFLGNARARAGKRGNAEQVAELAALLKARDLPALAGHWVNGSEVDWQQLHAHGSGRRISLPTYPFARERYWFATRPDGGERPGVGQPRLHPLVHRNTSTLREQKFTTRFTGEEFFLADHIVDTQRILPGVAYVEMARVAGELATEQTVRCVRDLVWERPLVVGAEAREVEIAISAQRAGLRFTVSTPGKSRPIIHCSGTLEIAAQPRGQDEVVDLDVLRGRLTTPVIDADTLYPRLHEAGLRLGPSFQIVRQIFASESESLAVLALPEHLSASAAEFGLHPALMDGSLHTAIGLMHCNGLGLQLSIPHSLAAVEVHHPLVDVRYVHATWRNDDPSGDPAAYRVSYLLMDAHGRVLARIRDLHSKPFYRAGQGPASAMAPQPTGAPLSVFRQAWSAQPLDAVGDEPAEISALVFEHGDALTDALRRPAQAPHAADAALRIVSVRPGASFRRLADDAYEIAPDSVDDHHALLAALAAIGGVPQTIVHAWMLRAPELSLEDGLRHGVHALTALSQALARLPAPSGGRRPLLIVHASPQDATLPQCGALAAFARCVKQEHAQLAIKCIEVGPALDAQPLCDLLVAEARTCDAAMAEVRHLGRQREVCTTQAATLAASVPATVRENGVYLITGGLGGLGLIFAEHLASQARVRLVLAGRSEPSAEQQARLQTLQAGGADVIHQRCDLSRADDVERLVATARERFGAVHGVIHAAGVLRDGPVRSKRREDVDAVLASKVFGTLHLDRATCAEPLDFFVMFSSVTAITGNAMQSDYAFANRFMDLFAEQRRARVVRGQGSGRSLAINWPLWKDGGMRIDAQIEALLEQATGFRSLDRASGLAIFDRALCSDLGQLLVVPGDIAKVARTLGVERPATPAAPMVAAAAAAVPVARSKPIPTLEPEVDVQDATLRDLLADDLLQIVSRVLMIDAARIARDVDLSEYGFDSIGLTKLFSEVSARYRIDLTPAMFFEYPTLEALCGFLVSEFRDTVQACFAGRAELPAERGPVSAAPVAEAPPAMADAPSLTSRFVDDTFGGVPRDPRGRDIAIVGVSGRFPQSENLERFWAHLEQGHDLIEEVPAERWDWRRYHGDPQRERNTTNSRWGGFLTDVDKFDCLFFGINPLEAEVMDPQQRMFLETVWQTVEDAGHSPRELAGSKTGVYVGVAGFDYSDLLSSNGLDVTAYTATGVSHCVLPNRISYLLDLHGPSEPVDTACSSSLVAIHRAYEAIVSGRCEMAIAGGVNALLTPALYLAFGNAGMLSGDGRCMTFDARANGYVRGEGCAAVLLKPLDRALADGNPIHAVIKAACVNHGGRATSLTAPNPNAQAQLLIDAYEQAGIGPDEVSYIEAHGTATPLGDPVELNALKKAFRALYARSERPVRPGAYCAVGSVKTNVGHLEMAAGIAGIAKVVLAMRHRRIPANVHFRELNPHIRLDGSPFRIVDRTCDWRPLQDAHGRALPRVAGVSSFGFGGANAHVVLQEFDAARRHVDEAAVIPGATYAVPLSARTAERLTQKATDLLAHLRARPETDTAELARIAYTLQVGRDAMDERVAFVVRDVPALIAGLAAFIDGQIAPGMLRGSPSRHEEDVRLIARDAEIRETIIDRFVQRGQLEGLLDLWVKGVEIDWQRLYGARRPLRTSLPGYPFARQRLWFDTALQRQTSRREPPTRNRSAGTDHPLLQRDVSDAHQIAFESQLDDLHPAAHALQLTLDGARHAVPASAIYLEMAIAAINRSLPPPQPKAVLELHAVTWSAAYAPHRAPRMSTAVYVDERGDCEVEIEGTAHGGDGASSLVTLAHGVARHALPLMLDRLDLAALRERLTALPGAADALYARLAAHGIEYASRYRALQACFAGRDQWLVAIAAKGEATLSGCLLVPELVEAVLQAALGLSFDDGAVAAPRLPVALERLRVFAPVQGEVYAWLRRADAVASGDGAEFDIDVCDAEGRIALQFSRLRIGDPAERIASVSRHSSIERLLEHVLAPAPSTLDADRIEQLKAMIKKDLLIK